MQSRIGPSAIALVALCAVGCSAPQPGEPCEPGDEVIDPGGAGCASGECEPILVCTGPRGCEGEPNFTWQPLYNGSGCGSLSVLVYGCDGQVHGSASADYGGPPNVRWRWYGGPEPCERARYDGSRWVVDTQLDCPQPRCACTNALPDPSCIDPVCACTDAEGFAMPPDCCSCAAAIVADDGRCVHGTLGLEMAAICCGG